MIARNPLLGLLMQAGPVSLLVAGLGFVALSLLPVGAAIALYTRACALLARGTA